MASHGTDQLIVQRLLACRSLRDSQKALITSGLIVMLQFAVFLLVGLLLWVYYGGVSVQELGLSRGDEIFPRFIIQGLPQGISGLIIAGIIAAAMSTLSSSLNSLASSSVLDLLARVVPRLQKDQPFALRVSRWATLFWGLVFIVFANLFTSQENPVVELGLAIASFTYGGLLGVFLLGLLSKKATQREALVAFFVALGVMVGVIFGIWHRPDGQWIWLFYPTDNTIQQLGLKSIAWPWYTVIGSSLAIGIGILLAHLRRK